MKKTLIIRLYFKNAIHIGASTPGIGIEGTDNLIIHSDTLWAALCNNWAIAGRGAGISFDTFLNSFKAGDPLFKISSAFPCSDEEFWLPKPLSVPFPFSKSNPEPDDPDNKKEIKSLNFIKLSHFKNWIGFDETAEETGIDEIADEENQPKKMADILRPHNTLDRISLASQIYHSGTTYFDAEKQSGFYFLLQTEEEKCQKVKSALEQILGIIQDTSGIGGNRSIGLGTIRDIEFLGFEETGNHQDDWEAIFPGNDEGKNAYCLLSLWHPNSIGDEPTGNDVYHETAVSYNMVLRKGWTGSLSVAHQVKRKTAHMFSEGSVFTTKPDGHLLDLSPDETPSGRPYPHPIYRYGYAFTVPMKIYTGD